MSSNPTHVNCRNCSSNCLFFHLPKEEGDVFYENKREVTFKKGEILYKQGALRSKVIFIQDGLIKTFIEGKGEKNLLIGIFGSREYLDLAQALGRNEENHSARALTKSKVCMIEVNYFRQRLLIDQSKNRNFLNLFTASHDFLYSRLMALGTKSLHGRLATALLYLNEDRFHHEDIFSHITRTDLAELSAMSIESLIRILKEFKQEDLIKLEGKRIEILNLNKMQSVSRNN